MNKQTLIKLLSCVLNISVSLIVVIIILFRQNWFGEGDVYFFIFWTVPLAAGLAVSGPAILKLFRTTYFLARLIFIILSGSLLSFLWVYSVSLVLGPWMGAFSFPIFYLWIPGSIIQLLFLEWNLPKPNESPNFFKSLAALLSFPLTVIVVVMVMFIFSAAVSFLTKPEKETYLIPADFIGSFRIIYGEKCGINPTVENGRQVLPIPSNGILIIQPKFKAGTIDNEYYLVDNTGNRKKIEMIFYSNKQSAKMPGVLLVASGNFGGKMPDGSSSSESPFAIHFTEFTVLNNDNLKKEEPEEFRFHERFDSLTLEAVNKCRGKGEL